MQASKASILQEEPLGGSSATHLANANTVTASKACRALVQHYPLQVPAATAPAQLKAAPSVANTPTAL